MRHLRLFIGALLTLLAVAQVPAQGLGFYLDGKKVELSEGDTINFSADNNGETTVSVSKNGEISVYRGNEMTFFGDIEQYLYALPGALHTPVIDLNAHYDYGYGSIMHIRDIMTADMFVPDNPYNHWYQPWSQNKNIGPNYLTTQFVWNYYNQAIDAANKLIGAIGENASDNTLRHYLGIAYAFRAMHYLDMARMYEYLPCDATQPKSSIGRDITYLTVPIFTEKTPQAKMRELTRATRREMSDFIMSDLQNAIGLLKGYQRTNKALPDLACVYGLIARLYMWDNNYGPAAIYARKAIDTGKNTPLTEQEMLDTENGFNTMLPSAWMWGAQPKRDDRPVTSGIINWTSWMCNEASFGYAAVGPSPSIYPSLYNMIGSNDCRKKLFKVTGEEPHLDHYTWNDMPAYASLKFRPYQGAADDYAVGARSAYPLMRVEEMYLIEAEAEAHTSPQKGLELLNNFMRSYRDPTYSFAPTTQILDSLIIRTVDEIVLQKRIELWGEGQSFFDIKRLDMPVDRTKAEDAGYVSDAEKFATATRPAWMNFPFLTPSAGSQRFNLIGYENPDPSGCYIPGGGFIEGASPSYSVGFIDGIFRDLFYAPAVTEEISITASPLAQTTGIALEAPFLAFADSTMGYQRTNLNIYLRDSVAIIPWQPLGFCKGDAPIYIESTQNGTFKDGVIRFPLNSITATYGNELQVINSNICTEIRLPGCSSTSFSLFTNFFPGPYQSSVRFIGGEQYLHTRLTRMQNLDEARLVCVPSEQADAAIERLKADGGYGATVRDTGWVDIPMTDCQGEFTIAVLGLDKGVIRYSSAYGRHMYPDYTVNVATAYKSVDNTGTEVVNTEYYFGPHVEKAYIALVEEDATEEEIREMYRTNSLPSMVLAPLSHSGEARAVRIPFPAEYGIYKVVALAIAGNKLVKVYDRNREEPWGSSTFEGPGNRELGISYSSITVNDDGSVTMTANVNIHDFDYGYATLVQDSAMTGNLGQDIANSVYRQRVTTDGEVRITVPNPVRGSRYTLAIAGCNAAGKILKTATGGEYDMYDPWTPWYSTKAEWTADGLDGNLWPLSERESTCTYTYKAYFSGDDTDLPIFYRQSVKDPTHGQFKIGQWCFGLDLFIEYDTETGACQVTTQYATNNSNYGEVYISDIPHYNAGYTYEQFPCTYDRETGRFQLSVAWHCSAGLFGNDVETVQVDGFYIPDYSISTEFEGTMTSVSRNTFAVVNVTKIGADVERALAAVAARSEKTDSIAELIASGDIEAIDLKQGSNLVPLNGYDGEMKVVVVSIAEGTIKSVEDHDFEYYANGSPWRSLGKGLYTDDAIIVLFGNETSAYSPETYEVEIQENNEKPGLYRLVDPYGPGTCPYYADMVNGGFTMPAAGKYLLINACDPDGVYVEHQSLGIGFGEGVAGLVSEGARYLSNYPFEEVKNHGLLGQLKDGVISFPSFDIEDSNGQPTGRKYQGYVTLDGELAYYAGASGKISVTLPEAVTASARRNTARATMPLNGTPVLRQDSALRQDGTKPRLRMAPRLLLPKNSIK